MFNNLINNIQNKINTIKEENKNYNDQLKKSQKLTNLPPLKEYNSNPTEKNIYYITSNCPDINKEKALLIAKTIPITETYLTIIYSKEVLTNTEYFLLPTDKYLWIINQKSCAIFKYENITICNIIKNNIMSKAININNIILEANGNDDTINNFINILNNKDYRDKIIKEKTSYLCGIIPIYQKINKLNSGISIDNNKNIVFHTNESNYKYNYQDITGYEILLDNTTIISNNTTNKITSMQNTCYNMNIRITTKDNKIILPILENSSIGTKYNYQDSIYQTNLNFAKEIINKLNELCQPKY